MCEFCGFHFFVVCIGARRLNAHPNVCGPRWTWARQAHGYSVWVSDVDVYICDTAYGAER